jgi:hypothetical protein
MMANVYHARPLRSIGSGGVATPCLPATDRRQGGGRRDPREIEAWTVCFLVASAEEADAGTEILRLMEGE